MKTVRCAFCHEEVPEGDYERHVAAHMAPRADGQQTDYATLPPEDRASPAEVAAAPSWYRHVGTAAKPGCGEVTGMPGEIIATYLADPWFYLADSTFCCGCGAHVPHGELVWEGTGENVGAYTDRLRAARPDLRPGWPKRALIAVLTKLFG